MLNDFIAYVWCYFIVVFMIWPSLKQ